MLLQIVVQKHGGVKKLRIRNFGYNATCPAAVAYRSRERRRSSDQPCNAMSAKRRE
jgi:hypothetical protein